MAELTIRTLVHQDLSGLLDLYRQLHEKDDPPPARAELDSLWWRILSDDSQIYLGGFRSGVLVSVCNAAVIPNLTRGARPYAVIENVVTDGAQRRRGFGGAVMRALLDRCWQCGCYKVMLMSGTERREVHAFYESLGFDKDAKQAFIIRAR